MQCRFVVNSVPWEKRKDLISHECVGLEEKIMSCERNQPSKVASKPDESNSVVDFEKQSKVKAGFFWKRVEHQSRESISPACYHDGSF